MTSTPAIVLVGEGMLEMSAAGRNWRLGYGGDTLNTAVHLARMGYRPAYMTALGADQFSDDLREEWTEEGVDTSLVLIDPDRSPGLYAIRTDENGERSFQYWRSESAAKRMFELPETSDAMSAAARTRLLMFSLISMAILPPCGRKRLLDLACAVKSFGGQVAFDGNYRPRLWSSVDEALRAREDAIACCDIGLPTLDDERALTGLDTAEAVASEWQARGASEVVVKLGEAGCLVGGRLVPPPARVSAVDTTGAGDAFNAAYLAARLDDAGPIGAAQAGHRLAGWVIARQGAIPKVDRDAPYSTSSEPLGARM